MPQLNKKLYFYFETFKKSKISIGLFQQDNQGFYGNYQVKLLDITNNTTINLRTIGNLKNEFARAFGQITYEVYNEIEKSKYLLSLDCLNISYLDLQNKLFKIFIEGNIENIKYLGYLNYKPTIYAQIQFIENTKYNYGLKTAYLFQKFKNIITVLETEFKVKMHPEARGYYIESIFKDDCETIVRFDKVKLKMQVCSYDKKDDLFFLGNNHVEGRVQDNNGKVIKLINNKDVPVYTGRITQNKLLDSEYIELNQQLSKELAKSPNIFIFKENSYIKSFLHPHKLKYKSAHNKIKISFS